MKSFEYNKKRKGKGKTMDTDFIIDDLRGTKNAPAVFRLTRKIPNNGTYSLLFKFYKDSLTLTLIGIEIESDNKEKYNKFPDFEIPDLTIPEIVEGYLVSTISSFAYRHSGYSWLGIGRLTIPNTIRLIGYNAFRRCIIKELYIPATVCEIQPLAQNSMIYSIKIDEGNKRYDSRNDCNAIIDTANNELILGSINSTIPDTVTKIGKEAFYMGGCGAPMKIVIPQSVLIIGERAFGACMGLEKAVIASSKIGKGAFKGCDGLKEILLSDTVTQIGEQAFMGCESLKEVVIPNSVTKIGKDAFRGCTGLERVEIPDSVTFIGLSAFLGCNKDRIIIKKASLLKAAFELPIDEMLVRQQVENSRDPKDLELLRFELQRCFKNIYREFYNIRGDRNEFYNRLNGDLNSALLHSIELKTNDGIGRILVNSIPFVKSIHLFGDSANGIGVIDLYIEKENAEKSSNQWVDFTITENRDELSPSDRQNPVLDPRSFIFAALDLNKMAEGVDIGVYPLLEYSTNPQETILNGKYYATIVADRNEEGKLYHEASPYLQATCDVIGFFDENRPLFHQMDLYSDVISNYFFISSYFLDNRGKADCRLLAKIGIDKKAKNNADEVKVFLTEFKTFMDSITQRISFMIQTHEHRQQALEGAIAKVMARNMSHNIGSHVFSHVVGNGAYESLSDKSVSELDSYISCYDKPKKKEEPQDAINHQLALFNKYLKNRMDYLSEVTFGVPNVVAAKSVYGEVFKDLDNVRILLNHISGISDFTFGFSLMHNGVPLSEEDIMVAFPGDVLGSQAFYNIIENIIRNTAKHANKIDHALVLFNINFIDEKDFPDYYCVEIDNGIKEPSIERLIREQNKMIDDNTLDQNFNLRTNGLGIVEMKTSCAFLRQLNITVVDSIKYAMDWRNNPNDNTDNLLNDYGKLILLKAINKDGALGYRFFIQKPKEFLLVGDFGIEVFQKDAACKEGVQFINEEDFAKVIEGRKTFAHPFLLYPNNLSDKTKALLSNENDSKTLLPIRKLELTKDEINEVFGIINSTGNIIPKLKELAWKKYMKSIGVESDNIYIGEVVGRKKYSNFCQVVFANHGENFETYWSHKKDLPELWVDSLSSYSQGKLPLFASYSLTEDDTETPLTRYVNTISPQLKMEIFEAYHNKVVALDERIQRFSLESFEGSIPTSTLFEATNVIIPKTKLDPEQFDESLIHELEDFINNEINGAFLLVHYGILERMYKTQTSISERLEAWSKKAKRVVVTSGRGSHSLKLPYSVCFVNLSSVLNAFTENRCKFLINYIINQSRRKNE